MFVEYKEAGEITDTPAKTLKLSEAIRIGARLKPQCTGRFWKDGKSCALGAAYEGTFGYMPDGAEQHDHGMLTMQSRTIQCDARCALLSKFRMSTETDNEIYRRNDCGESRESIADWLESRGL